MVPKREFTLREKLLFLALSLTAISTSWFAVRSWLVTTSLLNVGTVHLIDVGIVSAIGVLIVALVTRWMSHPLISIVGPTETNAVKLLFQLVGLSLVLFVIVSFTGVSLVSTLVGLGFFGLVIGLAAQSVLGNLFSGIMLLASRPFHINDRIALVTWQYGKFPPTLAHGWLEPSYTGVVRSIALTYTTIQTDADAMLKVPNALVTQSLLMNLSHDRQGYIGTQFEVPIRVDPDDLRRKISLELFGEREFIGKEQSYEVLDISPTSYLVAIDYRVEQEHERETKNFLLKSIRLALVRCLSEVEEKGKRDQNTPSQINRVRPRSLS
jgi:small-conductance mechanosensitive channel